MPTRRAEEGRTRASPAPPGRATPAERLADARSVADEATRRRARFAAWRAERDRGDDHRVK